jgi:hypothetical protein
LKRQDFCPEDEPDTRTTGGCYSFHFTDEDNQAQGIPITLTEGWS